MALGGQAMNEMSNVIRIEDWKHARDQRIIDNNVENEVRRLLSRAFVLREGLFVLKTKEECVERVAEIFDLLTKAKTEAAANGVAIMLDANTGQYSVGRYLKEGVKDD
jgi:predicted nucleic acid-binding protein